MKQNKYLLFVILLVGSLLGLTALIGISSPTQPFTKADCPVTRRGETAFKPPEPYRSFAPQGTFWHGTPDLWTGVPTNYTWEMLPRWGDGYGNKLAYWSVHYDIDTETMPDIRITARRVDAPYIHSETPHLGTNAYTPEDGWFMITGVELPTTGCWEITAAYREAELSYIIWFSQ